MKEYKVLSQKDKWFSGKFDPDALEQALNSYAAQGWNVAGCVTASMPGLMGGNREEMVIILERDNNRQAEETARQQRLKDAAAKTFASPSPPKPAATSPKPAGGEPDVYTL